MPTINLGPCACCGGAINCCNEFGTDWMPQSFQVDFSSPTNFLSSTSAQEVAAVTGVLQAASYTAIGGLGGYDHGYGTGCIPSPPATCNLNPCADHPRTMTRANSANRIVGGRLSVACGEGQLNALPSGAALYSVRLSDFSQDVTEIVEYLTTQEWAVACQSGASVQKWRLDVPNIPASSVSGGYSYNSTQRRIEVVDPDCDERTSAYQFPAASWVPGFASVSVSSTFAQQFGLTNGFSKAFQFTITVTPSYLP